MGRFIIGILEFIVGAPNSINGLWKRKPVNPFSDEITNIMDYRDRWVRIWTNYGEGGGDYSTMKYRAFRRKFKRIA